MVGERGRIVRKGLAGGVASQLGIGERNVENSGTNKETEEKKEEDQERWRAFQAERAACEKGQRQGEKVPLAGRMEGNSIWHKCNVIGAQRNTKLKRQTEPAPPSSWDTEDNRKPLKCFVLERSLPGPATRLKDGKAGGTGPDVKAVSITQEEEEDGFVLGYTDYE